MYMIFFQQRRFLGRAALLLVHRLWISCAKAMIVFSRVILEEKTEKCET